MSEDYRRSVSPPLADHSRTIWTVALADGLFDTRPLLEHALDRLVDVAPPARTLAVTGAMIGAVIGATHGELAGPQLRDRADHVLRQPAARGTGMALYIALAMLRRWAPNAVVIATPTDYHAEPAGRFTDHVRRAASLAACNREAVVVLAAEPTATDAGCGYVTVGPDLRVAGFSKQPGAGALWNTGIACATVDALWALGRATQPHLLDILDSFVPLVGTPEESEALDYIYLSYLPVDFSREMLQRAPDRLLGVVLDGVAWTGGDRARKPPAAAQAHGMREALTSAGD